MKKFSSSLIVLIVLAVTLSYEAPRAEAAGWRTTTRFYDAWCVQVGWRIVNCNNAVTTNGSQTGVWKEVQYDECLGEGQTFEYYHYCNGTWVPVGFLGDPSC